MKIQETQDGWEMLLEDGHMLLIQIDFRVAFDFADGSDSATLTIETEFRLKGPDVDKLLNPEESSTLGPILPLHKAKIVSVDFKRTGQLKIEFGEGYSIEVGPNDRYEAWQLGCTTPRSRFICTPGGDVSRFDS